MPNHRSKVSLTTANERVTQTSHLLALVTESHNLAAELVEMVKERDTWKRKVPIGLFRFEIASHYHHSAGI